LPSSPAPRSPPSHLLKSLRYLSSESAGGPLSLPTIHVCITARALGRGRRRGSSA
jgi:hypothetical protein